MAKQEKYNGWSNRSTWLVALHADNTEYIYLAVNRVVVYYAEMKAAGTGYNAKKAQSAVRSVLISSGAVDAARGDCSGRFGGVNWREITDSLIDEAVLNIRSKG